MTGASRDSSSVRPSDEMIDLAAGSGNLVTLEMRQLNSNTNFDRTSGQ